MEIAYYYQNWFYGNEASEIGIIKHVAESKRLLIIDTSTLNNSSFEPNFKDICPIQLGKHLNQVSFIYQEIHSSFIPFVFGKMSVSYSKSMYVY